MWRKKYLATDNEATFYDALPKRKKNTAHCDPSSDALNTHRVSENLDFLS